MVQPAQMAKANSRPAKNTNIPATRIEATVKLRRNNIVISADIIRPNLAANIFGALSICFKGKLRALLKLELK